MKTILVATDFSKSANNACLYAIEMAKEIKADIILLHVFETPLLFAGQYFTVYYELAEKKLKAYQQKITKLAGKVKISLALQQGLPSSRITEFAIEKKVDLVIVGTSNNEGIAKIIFGSNALRIFRHSTCPVMAIPTRCKYKGIHKITYATDLKKDNISSAKLLFPFAAKFNAEITFLNVSDALEKEEFNSAAKELNKQIKKYFNYPKLSGYVCNNLDASEGINFYLKHHSTDCLAPFSHQRNLFQHIFGESITKRISLHAKTPLLIIPEAEFLSSGLK